MRAPAIITRNLRIKLLCLFAAMLTWAGVVYAANPPETRVISVPVPQSRELIPAKYVLATPIADIQVRISGTRSRLDAFDVTSLELTVGYASIADTGNQNLSLQVVNHDINVVMNDADWPHSVAADVDTIDSKLIPVTIVTDPPPPFGYVVSTAAADPAAITVTGAHRALSASGVQARVTLNMSNQKANVQSDSPVFLFDSTNHRVNDLAVLPPTVRVTVTVTPTQTSRSVAVLPKTTGQVAAGHQLAGLSIDPPTTVISGPRDVLNALDAIGTALISLNNLTGDTTIVVKIAPPAGITAVPDTVTVHLHIIALPVATPTPSPSASPTPTPGPT